MKQKRIRNDRYKPLTKEWLLSIGVDVVIDGVSTREIPSNVLRAFYYDYETLEVRQYSNKFKKWIDKTPKPNTKIHEKGIIGKCTYYQISLSVPKQKSVGIPLHRIVYVWFHDIIEPYNENNEKMEICHIKGDSSNNHITNLVWDTAKNNRAQRKGAVNQHGYKKKEKFGLEALYENTK